MNIVRTDKVKDLVNTYPASLRLFEQLGIDYCCGGFRTLDEACQKANLPTNEVIGLLEATENVPQPTSPDWQRERMTALIDYIVERHHGFTRQEITRLENLLEKVCSVHAPKHPEVLQLKALFDVLKQDLVPHMLKEEQVLFPYITRLEEAVEAKQSPAMPFFGTVQHPVNKMMSEHDTAGDVLRDIRKLTNDYQCPPDGCITFQTLYAALEAFEIDLHEHIHLENNLLFPRALAVEKSVKPEWQAATGQLAHCGFGK
jgi:regulator of cell morphogenesis and NO signaling